MLDKRVSVIIPTFNSGNYIKTAIESALQQDYKNLEIIVIDDGSTDNTIEVIDNYVKTEKIRYFYQENAGLSAARNTGIALSKGELIAFLDADDIWMPDKIGKQVKFITSNHADMVFTDFHVFNEKGIIIKNKNMLKIEKDMTVTFQILFSNNNFIYPSTVLVKRDVFDKCGFFDVSLDAIEDYDMWLRIAKYYRITGMQEALTLIREHESNMSKDISRMLNNEIKVILKHRNDVNILKYLRRKSKVFMLNADRSIHQSDKKQAIKYFLQGLVTYPFLLPDTLIVVIKFILGGKKVDSLRSNFKNGLLRKAYELFYKYY